MSATTGKAFYNVSGLTIHSLLKLPVGSRACKDLIGKELCRLQENLLHSSLMNTQCFGKLPLAGLINGVNKQLEVMIRFLVESL